MRFFRQQCRSMPKGQLYKLLQCIPSEHSIPISVKGPNKAEKGSERLEWSESPFWYICETPCFSFLRRCRTVSLYRIILDFSPFFKIFFEIIRHFIMKFYRWAPQKISVRLSAVAFPRNFSAKTRNTKSMLSFSLPVLRQNRPQNNREVGVCHNGSQAPH